MKYYLEASDRSVTDATQFSNQSIELISSNTLCLGRLICNAQNFAIAKNQLEFKIENNQVLHGHNPSFLRTKGDIVAIPTDKFIAITPNDQVSLCIDEYWLRLSGKKERETEPKQTAQSPAKKIRLSDEKITDRFKVIAVTSVGEWRVNPESTLLVMVPGETRDSDKIASFDFDSTLANTKSGKKFATSASDWEVFDDAVKPKLKALYKQGYKLVIFTNQKGVKKGKMTIDSLRTRLEAFLDHVNVPMYIFAAIGDDYLYRKPNIGMLQILLSQFNGTHKTLNMSESFYCGDAAGRKNGWKPGKSKDFSCGDRKFALNTGLKFFTPEETFLDEPATDNYRLGFDPFKYKETAAIAGKVYHKNHQEMVINVGMPASGKSTFAKQYLVANGYVHVNRDKLGTQAKCIKAAREALEEGKSVVIDNTNPSISARAAYLEIAKEFKIPTRCFVFKVDLELAGHLNRVREQSSGAHIPKIAYNIFRKGFRPPQKSEGFTEVTEMPFEPIFENEKAKQLFYRYYESE